MTKRFAVLNIVVILGFTSPAFAEPPPASTDTASVKVKSSALQSSVIPLILKNAHHEISSRLKVVLFQDDVSGESAALQVTPILPGCKVGLTYRF